MNLVTTTRLTLAAIWLVAMSPNALAETITTVETTRIVQPAQTSQPSKVVTTTVKKSAPRQSNYLKRLARIMEQIEQGENKGWLTAEQAKNLRDQQKILVDKEATYFTNGNGMISKADGDCLEKEINGLNISVTSLMNNGIATESNNQL